MSVGARRLESADPVEPALGTDGPGARNHRIQTMPELKAAIVPVTPFQQNCTILWEEPGKLGVVVDPGGDVPRLLEAIRDFEVRISNAPGSLQAAWAPERLFGSPAFQAAVRTPMEKPAFFLAREREYADWSKRARGRPDPGR